jgi:hypothetical protein
MRDLMNFNVFGLMKVSRHQITTTFTAMSVEGKSINRIFEEDTDCPEIAEGEIEAILFGAFVSPGNKAKVAIRELSNGNFDPVNNKQVARSLQKALDLVQAA